MAIVIKGLSTEQLRKLYRTIRNRSEARSTHHFDDAVRTELVHMKKAPPDLSYDEVTPIDWVRAALRAKLKCGRCAGTGQFVTYVENGVPKGPGGICFRCEGKGYQTDRDVRRNYVHDIHYCGGMR